MPTSAAPSDPVETATDSAGSGNSRGAIVIAIGALLLLVILILTNMK